MEEYTHCQKYLFFDPAPHENFSFTTREEATSSSSSPPEFHINFRLSCKPHVSHWEVNQDSPFPQLLRVSDLPTVTNHILLNLDQFLNQESACQIIGEEIKSWPVWDGGRQLLIDFVLDKALEVVESMPPSHNAVYLTIHVVPVHIHVFDETEAIRLATEQSMEEGYQDCMVPAADSVIESLESMKITLIVDDFGTCPVCLEEFSKDSEAVCMPCSHVFHDGCITEWLSTSHYCPICRFEMPTN